VNGIFAKIGAPITVAAVVGGVLVLAIIAGGYDLPLALSALWKGSFGGSYAFASATLVRATPLVLVGLAVALAFRCGILNIGAEGQLLAGASAAIAVGLAGVAWSSPLIIPVELAAGIMAGAAWAGIAALLKRTFGVLEVISTLMLNFIAQYSVGYLVRGPLQEPTHVYPATASIGLQARLPLLIEGQRLNIGFPIAVTLAISLWWFLRATAWIPTTRRRRRRRGGSERGAHRCHARGVSRIPRERRNRWTRRSRARDGDDICAV
jgi:ABC-type uncharacterized transport system permease subunit